MILSRAAELGRLDELLAGLRAGNGRALVVHGEPGIGKTTLLDALAERCGDDVTVLTARGVETEAELAFAGLADLLAPIVTHLDDLPEPQAAALAAALALGPPAPGDRLALCVAALGVLRAAAAARPLLVVVDDVPWFDAASRECVLYAARRAGGRVAVVLAARDPWDELERTRLPRLPLGPLPEAGALDLLRRRAPDLAPAVAHRIAAEAAGNPLALVELPETLTAGQRAGIAAVEFPIAPGNRLQAAFARRIEELDAPARRALLVAAAHMGDDLATIAAACRETSADAARLAAAEERGLVRIRPGVVRFSHPLVRASAYHAADPAERRRAHRALGNALAGERRAWHLAEAAVGPDDELAAELERVGDDAAARRAFASASAAHERAARLSREPQSAARRLASAAEMASAAGARERALALLEEAAGASGDGPLRARARHLHGRILAWQSPVEAIAELVAEAQRAAVHDRVLAAAMLADAAHANAEANDYHRAERLAREAVELLGNAGGATDRAPVLTMLGWMLALRGRAPEARPLLLTARRLAQDLDPLGPHWPWMHVLLRARIQLEELEQARAESAALCERAGKAGALTTLAGALLVAAEVAYRLGDWPAADELTLEAVRASGDIGQSAFWGFAICTRARLAAARGLEAESREAMNEVTGLPEATGITAGLMFVHGTLGFLALSAGHVDQAIAELETVERILADSGFEEPTIVPWAPDLAEAYARAGRTADAGRLQATLDRQAASSRTAYAGAAASRCRGMIEDDFEPAFEQALTLHDQRPMPFERARTLLAYGRRLHRARRRAEARGRLREALAAFERLGAGAWAAQARDELRAAGARRRAPRSDGLTPQEQRVVAAVRRGATNREIAAEMFLAPKTVEFHLRQIYRKLGVRSRTQLVATLAGDRPIERH
jgi:DNA-binding CsgD family transcriptional regulator